MAEIRLTINGRLRNVNLARLDWTEAGTINSEKGGVTTLGDLIFDRSNALCSGTLQNVPSGEDDAFYIFKTEYATGRLVSGLEPLAEQKGGRVLYFGANQKTGDTLRDFFRLASFFDDPPNPNTQIDIEATPQYTDLRGAFGSFPLRATGADVSNVYACYNAVAWIQTEYGGSFGASLCTASDSARNAVLVHSYGTWKYYEEYGAFPPDLAPHGNQAFRGKPYGPRFLGNSVIPYPSNEVSYNAAVASSGVYTGTSPTLTDDLSAEMMYTEIGGKPYLGLAACRWANGERIAALEITFLPAWFWGGFEVPDGVNPAQISQYWGFDAEPNRESGSYSYTAETVDFPTAVQPYSGIASDGHGLHVYKMTGAEYDEVLSTLWGDGTFAQAIWRKFQNYKSNPIAAICACHKLPGSLMPTLTTQVQIRAAGCALTAAAGAYYANSKTTVDETARVLNVGKFFTSFLNWDPYTSCDLFLPFVGWTKIPADRIMGGSLTIKYRCDIITGNVSVLVRCFSGANGTGTNTATYQHTGNAALSVPISGNDNGTGKMLGAIAAGIGVAAAGIASGGSAALAAAGAGAGLGAATAKNTLQTASDYSGNAASIGILTPFLIITMPIEYTSKEFRDLHGTASGIGVTVGQLEGTGYTEFSQYKCDFECTEAEAREIEDIMKSGVIL